MLKFTLAACQRCGFGGRQRRPLQGNPASDRMLRGPGCNRHSSVCADTSIPFAGLPRRCQSDGHRDAFSRHDGIYRSDVVQNQKPNPGTGTVPPPVGRPRAQVKERAGRITPFSSSAMSSGRLFLDRVGRHQSPSPLHRRDQNNLVARSERTIYHRTVTSVLTGCLTLRDKRTQLTLAPKTAAQKNNKTPPSINA
jgi:hypothetical protein